MVLEASPSNSDPQGAQESLLYFSQVHPTLLARRSSQLLEVSPGSLQSGKTQTLDVFTLRRGFLGHCIGEVRLPVGEWKCLLPLLGKIVGTDSCHW